MSPVAAPVFQTRYLPAAPLDLELTLSPLARGGNGPHFFRDPSGTWIASRTPLGPGTLHLSAITDGVSARAFGPGAEWLISEVPELLGAQDDWSQLNLEASPLLSAVRRAHPGLRLGRHRRVVDVLIPTILEQKVTTVEAWRAWRSLARRYGDPAPGPLPSPLVLPPTPEAWSLIPSWEWHRAGVGPQRSATVMRAVARADALERTISREPAIAESLLCTVPGIGAWSAAETTARSHGHPDAVSVGDYHLAASVGMALRGSPATDAEMLELLEPWAGQRQRVLRLLALSGIQRPRRGPKITIQDHRGH